MTSLFDDPGKLSPPPPSPERAPRPPGPRSEPARHRRSGIAPAAAGLFVTLAVLVGILIGRAAFSPGGGAIRTADQGGLRLPGSTSPGSPGVPAYGFYAAPGGTASGGGAGGRQDAGMAGKVNPAIVYINSTFAYQGAQGAGTGIVLTADGEILTNNHVVNGASSISVTDVGNGQTYAGTVVGYDRAKDIAVVKLQNASGLQTAKLGDSSQLKVGQNVVAIGNAGGRGATPVSAPGQVTGLDKSITAADELAGTTERLTGLIEVAAAVESGDSGGPLVNTEGVVIGVDTAASAGYSFRSAASQGFAVPINDALAIVKQIDSGQATASVHVGPTAFLGVLISATDRGVPGAQVTQVAHGGAAARAGLVGGDLITSVAGQSIGSPEALSKLILSLTPGERVAIGWVDSAGQSRTATTALGTGPPA